MCVCTSYKRKGMYTLASLIKQDCKRTNIYLYTFAEFQGENLEHNVVDHSLHCVMLIQSPKNWTTSTEEVVFWYTTYW